MSRLTRCKEFGENLRDKSRFGRFPSYPVVIEHQRTQGRTDGTAALYRVGPAAWPFAARAQPASAAY